MQAYPLVFYFAACLGYCYSAPIPDNGMCEDRLLVVMGNNSLSSSMTVQVGYTQTGNATGFIADIHGCQVSYECSRNPGSCISVRVGDSYVAIPANGSVAFVKSSDQFFVEHLLDGSECDPTEIYYSEAAGFIWIVCCEQDGSIWLFAYAVMMTSDRPTRNGGIVRSEVISSGGGSTILHQVFVDDDCMRASMFVLINNTILHYTDPNHYVEGPKLENCTGVSRFTRVAGTMLVAQCSEGTTAVYDACRGRWDYHYPEDRVRYLPCGPTVGVRHDRDFIQVVNSSMFVLQTHNHSLGEIALLQCNEHLLYALSTSGIEYIAPLAELGADKPSSAVNMMCSRPSCSVPYLDDNGLVVLDDENRNIRVYSTSNQCRHSLVLEERMNFIRNGVNLPISLSSSSRHVCPCFHRVPNGGSEPPPRQTTEEEPPRQTTEEEPFTPGPKVNHSIIGLSVGFPFAFLFAVSVVAVVVGLLVCHSRFCKTAKQELSRHGSSIYQEGAEIQACAVEETAGGDASLSTGKSLPHQSRIVHREDVALQLNKTEEENNDRTNKVNFVHSDNR